MVSFNYELEYWHYSELTRYVMCQIIFHLSLSFILYVSPKYLQHASRYTR